MGRLAGVVLWNVVFARPVSNPTLTAGLPACRLAGPAVRVSSSSVCLLASRPFWRSGVPPQPWRGSWRVQRAPPARRRCPRRIWDTSDCSFRIIIADAPLFVTSALGSCRMSLAVARIPDPSTLNVINRFRRSR